MAAIAFKNGICAHIKQEASPPGFREVMSRLTSASSLAAVAVDRLCHYFYYEKP